MLCSDDHSYHAGFLNPPNRSLTHSGASSGSRVFLRNETELLPEDIAWLQCNQTQLKYTVWCN